MSTADHDVRAVLSTWKELQPSHVDLYVTSGIGNVLIELKRSGFECSEDAHLLLLCPDPTHYEESLAYLDGGKVVTMRFLVAHDRLESRQPMAPREINCQTAWMPLPTCTGSLYPRKLENAVDMTNGMTLNVLHLADLELFINICLAVASSDQFGRFALNHHTNREPAS